MIVRIRCIAVFVWFVVFPALAFSQTDLTSMEYFIDEDPGVGNGMEIPLNTSDSSDIEFALNLEGLQPGFHTLYIRAINEDGEWGLSESRSFYVEDTQTKNSETMLTSAEYYFNNAPGQENGIPIEIETGSDLSVQEGIETTSLDPGFHTLHVRVRNSLGIWGHPESRTFFIQNTQEILNREVISGLEYFIDSDPGIGEAEEVTIDSGGEVNYLDELLSAELEPGFHTLFIRARNDNGVWGNTESRSFYIREDSLLSPRVVAMEYYFGDDPGVGQANTLDMEPDTIVNVQTSIPTNQLELGNQFITVRAQNAFGGWSMPVSAPFMIGDNIRTVQFQVDMSVQEENDLFIPDQSSVYVGGSFNGFELAEMEPADDLIYQTAIGIEEDEDETIEYKFYHAENADIENGTWEGDVGPGEDGRRTFDLSPPGESMILDLVLFNNQGPAVQLPEPVLLQLPQNQAEDVAVNTSFEWSSSERAEGYTFQLSQNNGFDPMVIDSTAITETTLGLDTALETSSDYFWRVRAENSSGSSDWSDTFTFSTELATSIEDPELPVEYSLAQNFPNPFNPSTTIEFGIPEPSEVLLEVYNVAGKTIAVLVNEPRNAGSYQVHFDASSLSSGIYIYRLKAGTFTKTRKLTLIK